MTARLPRTNHLACPKCKAAPNEPCRAGRHGTLQARIHAERLSVSDSMRRSMAMKPPGGREPKSVGVPLRERLKIRSISAASAAK